LAYPRYVERWLIRHSRRLICPDLYARDKIKDLFLVKDEDVSIVSPLPKKVRQIHERETFPAKTKPRILYYGSLNSESGVEDLLWACARLVAWRAPHLRLLLAAGAGSRSDVLLRKMIRQLKLSENVRFLIPTGRDRPPEDLLQQADLLVIPGRGEFVGNLVLEAMAAGLPIVAADCGAAAQLIEDGVNGLKFPYGEGRSLTQAMAAILFNPKLYRRLTREARREVRRQQEAEPLLLKIYQELCAGSRRARKERG
jgi:glycosyltransferase involved in cell wall biosynthesis